MPGYSDCEKVYIWSSVVLCALITFLQLRQLWRNYTKLRAFYLACSLMTVGCAVLNVCRLYGLVPEYGYIAVFMLFSAVCVFFSNLAFLDLGKRFCPDRRLCGKNRTWTFVFVFVCCGMLMAISLSTSVFYIVIHRVHESYFVSFCVTYCLAMLAEIAGANYAFSPLMEARRSRTTTIALDAFTIGFWYLAISNIWATLYAVFYIVVLAKGRSYFMDPNCHATDFLFRAFFGLIFSTTPSRAAIALLRRRLFHATPDPDCSPAIIQLTNGQDMGFNGGVEGEAM